MTWAGRLAEREVITGMTIEELNQLAYLQKAIALEKERLERLRESVDVKSPVISDMPKAPGARDKLGEVVPNIVDQKAQIEETIRTFTELQEKILRFINGTTDAKMRMILILRFVDQKSWQEVADYIDNGQGKDTDYTVKQACYRYVEGKAYAQIPGQVSMF